MRTRLRRLGGNREEKFRMLWCGTSGEEDALFDS
jgi:hypothetical protein